MAGERWQISWKMPQTSIYLVNQLLFFEHELLVSTPLCDVKDAVTNKTHVQRSYKKYGETIIYL